MFMTPFVFLSEHFMWGFAVIVKSDKFSCASFWFLGSDVACCTRVSETSDFLEHFETRSPFKNPHLVVKFSNHSFIWNCLIEEDLIGEFVSGLVHKLHYWFTIIQNRVWKHLLQLRFWYSICWKRTQILKPHTFILGIYNWSLLHRKSVLFSQRCTVKYSYGCFTSVVKVVI